MRIKEFIDYMNDIAPLNYAESWDHCGLQFGREDRELTGVILALDLLPQVLDLAIEKGCNLIFTHHPAIFQPLQTITNKSVETELVLKCIEHGVAVFSAHTNLDNAVGGVNDALLAKLGYTAQWTPIPSELEVQDTKIFDGPLTEGIPKTVRPGSMRALALPNPMQRKVLTWTINQTLLTSGCMINFDTDGPVERLAVSGGSFPGEWIGILQDQEIDFLLNGEIKYHDMLSMAGLGIACVACGHDTSERVVLEPLAKQFKMDDVAPKIEVYGGLNYNNIVF
ncbi:MAG: Nif3-like dinuclear metal center hexameric protein [Clostridiaceae bacterium]|nr:Nif3-like dinuclear metal center hexameric protein [Clostridiaceae bacterium]